MYSYYEHLVKAVREYATDKPGNLGGLLGTLGGSRNNGGLSLRRPPPAEPVVRSLVYTHAIMTRDLAATGICCSCCKMRELMVRYCGRVMIADKSAAGSGP